MEIGWNFPAQKLDFPAQTRGIQLSGILFKIHQILAKHPHRLCPISPKNPIPKTPLNKPLPQAPENPQQKIVAQSKLLKNESSIKIMHFLLIFLLDIAFSLC